MAELQAVWYALNDEWEMILALGLLAVGSYNAWRWRQDQALAWRLAVELRPPVQLRATPKVSILVAAWNEADMIDAHIQSVLRLRYPNKEHILCAGGKDGTYALARRYSTANVTVLEQQPAEGKQRALGRCLACATGNIVYLTDADCLLDDDSFERILAPLINECEAAATGTNRPLDEQLAESVFVRMQWAIWYYRGPATPCHISGLLGRNAAIKRDVLESVGGLSADVRSGTDRFLAGRLGHAGHRIRYVGDSWIQTRFTEATRPYVRQQARWVRNLVKHGWRFKKGQDVLHGIRTIGFGVSALLLTVLLPLGGTTAAVAISLIVHVLLSRARYLGFGRLATSNDWPLPWLQLLAHFYLDAVAWSLAGLQLMTGRAEKQW